MSNKAKSPVGAERPFPWRCRSCGKVDVYLQTVRYDAEVRNDGRLHQFTIAKLDCPVCKSCGKIVVTEAVDDQINVALRKHLHLMTPAEMDAALSRVGLTQKDAAERLGIAEATDAGPTGIRFR